MSILQSAKRLAKYHIEAESKIKEILLFPGDNEIRLLELDGSCSAGESAASAFYWPADPALKIDYPWGVAVIAPKEKGKIPLPEGWGDWDKGVVIWRKGRGFYSPKVQRAR